MRFSLLLLAARGNPTEPVPFKEIIPLKLKTTVSGKGSKSSDVCCIYEMSLLFACFEKNNFSQSVCAKEVENFQKCYKNHMETKRIKYDRETKGILTPGDKRLSSTQLNILLKKFPNFK